MNCITIETKGLTNVENLFEDQSENREKNRLTDFDIGQTNSDALSSVGQIVLWIDGDHCTELIRTDFLTVSTEKTRLNGEFIYKINSLQFLSFEEIPV